MAAKAAKKQGTRLEELMGCFDGMESRTLPLVSRLVAQMVYLEGELDKAQEHPLLEEHKGRMVRTDASRVVASLMQTYSGIVEKLVRIQRKGAADSATGSPLREWLASQGQDG